MADANEFEEPIETAVSARSLAPAGEVRVLELRAPDGLGGSMSLDRSRTLGAAPGVDLRIEAPTVSRLHARVHLREGRPWVTDLDSKNGVRVDGLRVLCAELVDGCELALGETKLVVRHGSDARRRELWPNERFGQLRGRSDTMRALFERIRRVAASDACVLVQGETGTGKDLVAQTIHEESARHARPFVVFDCSAVPEALFEAELFGHVRGAFTGADRSRDGAASSADGGTLFLDEVGELPLSLQPKLLRFLESGTVRRVGESRHQRVDVRVVAATHRDLARMVADGSFREDLYFRLVVLPLEVPPLRDRREDIPLLVAHFARGRSVPRSVLEEASDRRWAGNVRELRTFVERVVALGPSEALRLSDGFAATPAGSGGGEGAAPDLDEPLRRVRERAADGAERAYLVGWLERTGRNVTAVAQAIGLDRTYVHRLLKKHHL